MPAASLDFRSRSRNHSRERCVSSPWTDMETMISAFDERRRVRRLRMIVDLTSNLIQNDNSMTHREARSLVDCAQRAISDLFPSYDRKYDILIRPHFERILRERWPIEETTELTMQCELVN